MCLFSLFILAIIVVFCDFYRDAATSLTRYLNKDLTFSIYEMPGGEFSAIDTARVLLSTKSSSGSVCQKRPIRVQQNCSFLVNCSLLKDRRDIRADDLGTWNHNGVITTYFKVKKDFQGKVVEISQQPKSFQTEKVDKIFSSCDAHIMQMVPLQTLKE